MSAKRWTQELGEPGQTPDDTSELLKQTADKRKRREIQRQEELDESEHEAKMAELEKKRKTAEADADKVEEKGVKRPPFDVEGKIILGNYDFQAMQREAQDELKRLKAEQDEHIRQLGQQNELLRDKIHEKEINVLQVTFQAQMDAITRALESNKASQKGLSELLTEARETAKAIGMAEPQTGGDAMIQIELKKLDFEHQVAMRRLMREEKQSDRQFQIDLRRLDDEREQRKHELEMQRKSHELWASAPAQIGSAFARGLMDQEAKGPDEKPQGKRGPSRRIEAGYGESGEIDCPSCGMGVGIGPTAKATVCAGCGERFSISRIAEKKEAGE